MNTIKKIGLATSLLCASSFANAAVYELGNATYNPDNYYNPDGFSSYEDLDHKIIFNDEGDYHVFEVKTFGSEFYSRLSVSGKFSDTFTFSLSKDSELSADVYASPDPVDFSLMQIDGFNATLYEYDNIVDEFGNDIVYYSFDADGNIQDHYYDDYFNYQFNIATSTGNWPDLTFEEYLVEQRGYFAITNTSRARLDPITLSAGTYSLIVEGEAYAPSDYSIRITSITSVTTTLITPVPEPSSIALMLGGLGLVSFMAARRKKT